MSLSTPKLDEAGSLDVYAKPFVPEFLLAINRTLPRQVYGGLKHPFDIDFNKYLKSFAGTLFLPEVQLPSDLLIGEVFLGLQAQKDPNISTFHEWLTFWLMAERQSFGTPQSSYDDYKVVILFAKAEHALEIVLTATIIIPGIAEDSPSIKLGDIVELRPLWLDHKHNPLHSLEGYARGYPTNQIYHPGWRGDAFHAEVSEINRVKETVHFTLTFQRQIFQGIQKLLDTLHFNVCFPRRQSWQYSLSRALRTVYNAHDKRWLENMLFPVPSHGKQQTSLNSAKFDFDPVDKLLNYEQLRAVDSVVKQNYGIVPFLIQGPPGTGKTKTIVEVCLQLLSTAGLGHILVCAPSDPAADTLAERLKASLAPDEMLRLNSPTRTFAEVPDGLLSFCCVDGDHFGIPSFPKMMSYKVVVTSCRDADLLVQARLTNQALYKFKVAMLSALQGKDQASKIENHWQAVLIDEAAQAIEAESLIPLTVVAPFHPDIEALKPPIVVMAGDQHQLGPRTTSSNPIMRTNLFERLLNRPLYADHPLARHHLRPGAAALRSLTKKMLPIIRPPFSNLLRNYRSHPAILAIPNALFYSETLLPEAKMTDSMLGWKGWRGSWPVLFSQNDGLDEIERDGGGWYNLSEVEMAHKFADSLLKSGLVEQRDICVMSPFSAQVRRLRVKFRSVDLYSVNIGPMEAFQGLESRVVILCTTRSRTKFLNQDKERGFGIINEKKRFNVAITRAKHGLIVIGTHQVLSVDPTWGVFLDFCIRNDLYDGKVDILALAFARQAPMPMLERFLKHKASQAEPSLLGITGELEDDMWIRGATETLPDGEDEGDDSDVEGFYTGEDGFGSGAVLDNVKMFVG